MELSGLLRVLAVMTRAGVPIVEALKVIAAESDSAQKHIAATARPLISEPDAGASVSEAFNRHPNLFPESVRNMMAIGEESGTIDRMLLEAAEHIERMTSIGRNMRQALIYPAFGVATILGAALFWVYYVIPNLEQLFIQMQVKLPAITRAVLQMSKWLEGNAAPSFILVAAIVIGIWLLLKFNNRSRTLLFSLAHRLPIARVLITASGMAFITEHLAIMIAAGVDI